MKYEGMLTPFMCYYLNRSWFFSIRRFYDVDTIMTKTTEMVICGLLFVSTKHKLVL